jgi:hypothetical protein
MVPSVGASDEFLTTELASLLVNFEHVAELPWFVRLAAVEATYGDDLGADRQLRDRRRAARHRFIARNAAVP